MIKQLNKRILKIIGGENLIASQLIVGIFGVVYGIVIFFYYFIKISQIYAIVFIICIVLGALLIYSARKDVLNGKIKTKQCPFCNRIVSCRQWLYGDNMCRKCSGRMRARKRRKLKD